MADPKTCPQCGSPLASDTQEGLCPKCLLQRGLESHTFPATVNPQTSPRWTPPAPADLAARFPELDLLELLGRGGMGAVYKAHQKSLDRIVALKILPPEIGQNSQGAFAERFAREAQAMAKLNHPHIVTIHDFGQREGLFFFIMEYVDGLSLRQLLTAGTVAPKEALAIVPQICEALQYAHDRGIVHRDIKPENILLNRQGQVKIADFGLAKLMGAGATGLRSSQTRASSEPRTTATAEVLGTPAYMAPEQRSRPADVDHRADIYSLGVVFYQMLTGQLPPDPLTPPSHKIHIDVRLDEIVLRALEQQPEKRYQQVSEVKTEVETIAATPATAGPVATLTARVERRFATLNKLVFWLVVAGAVSFFLSPVPVIVRVGIPLVGFVTGLLIVLVSPKRAGGSPVRQKPAAPPPRLSRTAILGVIGPALFALFVASLFGVPDQKGGMTLSPMTLTAGFVIALLGMCVLGCISLSQIRRSAGRLYGLPLALFDALLFPLLALDALLIWWLYLLIDGLARHAHPEGGAANMDGVLIIALPLAAALDALIVWFAWRAAKKPLPTAALSTPTPPASPHGHAGHVQSTQTAPSPNPRRLSVANIITAAVSVLAIWLLIHGDYLVATFCIVFSVAGIIFRTTRLGDPARAWRGTALFVVGLSFACLAIQSSFRVDRNDFSEIILVIGSVCFFVCWARTLRSPSVKNNNAPPAPSRHPRRLALNILIFAFSLLTLATLAVSLFQRYFTASPTALTFGPIIERVVPKQGATIAPRFLNLATGDLVTPPPDLPNIGSDTFKTWAVRNHADLIADWSMTPGPFVPLEKGSSDQIALNQITDLTLLGLNGCTFTAIPTARWESITPDQVRNEVRAADAQQKALAAQPHAGLINFDELFQYEAQAKVSNLPATFLFHTPAEDIGVLQILGYTTDLATGVNIRYKVVLNSTPTPATSPAPFSGVATQRAPAFGPVIERTLTADGSEFGPGRFVFLDLDQDKVVSLPTDDKTLRSLDDLGVVREWTRDHGIDLVAEIPNKVLMGLDLIIEPLDSELWDADADWLRNQRIFAVGTPGWPTVVSGEGALPRTYAFKTREGGLGLLQILAFTDNPHAVKIRYKLLQPSPTQPTPFSGVATQSAPAPTAPPAPK